MRFYEDQYLLWLVGAVLLLLGVATGIGQFLRRQTDSALNPAVVDQFNLRIRAWWLLCAVLAAAFYFGQEATVILFGGLSFWALREFITLTPTRLADHRALFWVFFLFTPLQYVLVYFNKYELFSILIPVYAFLFIPARIALAGDYKRYLERTAKIQAALMICVYCLSHAPELLYLNIAPPSTAAINSATPAPMVEESHASDATPVPGNSSLGNKQNARLLFFFILVVTMGDAFHYTGEKLLGRHAIAPAISLHKTWEGLLVAVGCGTLFGTCMWWATPFQPSQAAGMSLVITTMGFAGGMTMSAIKRDRGVRDYGTLVEGHGGVLDRIDSVCFAAPVFYHFTRLLFPQ